MEILNGLMSNGQPKQQQSAEEIIATLCDRMTHSRLASDKRAAILTLKGFSRKFREQVVSNGLRTLIQTLKEYTEDIDLLKATLETLLILFICGEDDDDMSRSFISQQSRLQNGKYPSPLLLKEASNTMDQFSLWIADEITQDASNIGALVSLLENTDFYIRLYTLQLLEALVSTRSTRTKDMILNAPLGIPSLVQILQDQHDPVRNEAVLLLMSLVNDNFNIQKLVAFDDTFEKLFEIIHEEGDIRGSIVVQDCLTLLSNLLKYNVSNQKLFMESNCLPMLAYLISEPISDPDIVWNNQRLQNISMALDIVRLFVLEGNESTPGNQDSLDKADIFLSVLKLSFSAQTPNTVRPTALLTVADMIAGNHALQLKFCSIDVPYIDPSLPVQLQNFGGSIPVITALLNWCLFVNSVHVFDIRVAAAHLLKAYFAENNEAKRGFLEDQISWYKSSSRVEVIEENQQEPLSDDEVKSEQSLKPESPDGQSVVADDDGSFHSNSNDVSTSIKQLKVTPLANLLEALLEYDPEIKLNPYKIWFSSFILINIIHDNDDLKHILRSVSAGNEDEGEEVMSSIQSISELLISSLNTQDQRISIGYLLLLVDWLFEDAESVDDFLRDRSIVRSLLSYLSQSSLENGITQGLITILLGIAFDFSSKGSPIPRSELHSLIIKMLGKDNYSFKILQFKENSLFSEFKPEDIFDPKRDETGLPEVFFHPSVVFLIKDNYYRIKNALNQNPELESTGRISYERFETLNDSYHHLKSDFDEFKSIAKKSQEETDQLLVTANTNLTTVQAKYDATTKDLENLNGTYLELDTKYKQTVKELEELQKLYSSLSEASSQHLKDFENSSSQLASKVTEIENLKKQLAEVEVQKKKHEDGINKMSRELFQLTKEKDDLRSLLKKSEKEVQKYTKQQEKLEMSLRQKTDDLGNLNKKLIELNNQLKASNISKSGLEKELKSLTAEGEKQSSLIEQLTEKLRSLANSHSELGKEKEDTEQLLEKTKKEFQSEISELKERVVQLDTTNAELVATIDNLKRNNEQVTNSLESAKADSESRLEELKNQSSSLVIELQELKQQLEASLKSSKVYESTIEQLKNQLKESTDEMTNVKDEHQQELDRRSNKHTGELAALQSKIDGFSLESSKSTKDSVALKSEINVLKELKASLTQEVTASKAEIEKITEKLSSKSSKLTDSLSRITDIERELASIKESREELSSKVKALEESLREKEEEVKSSNKLLKTTRHDLEKELDDNAVEFETKEDEYKKKINVLEQSVSSLEEEKKTLSSSLEMISQAIESKDMEHEVLLKQRKTDSTEIDELRKTIAELSQQKSKTEGELREQTDLFNSLEGKNEELLKELASVKNELKRKESKVSSLEDKLTAQKESHSKAVDELKANISDITKSMESKSKEFEKERVLLSQNSDSTTQEYSEKVTNLEEQLKNSEKKHQAKIDLLMKETEKLSEKIEELDSTNKMLCDDIASKNEQFDESSNELNNLKDKLKSTSVELNKYQETSKQLEKVQGDLKMKNENLTKIEKLLETLSADFKQKLDESKKREADVLKENFAHLKDLENLTKKSETLESELKKLNDENKKLLEQNKSLVTSADESNRSLQTQSKEAQTKLDVLTRIKDDEIENLRVELTNLEKKVIDSAAENKKSNAYHEKRYTSLTGQKVDLESINDDLKEKIAKLDSESESIQELRTTNVELSRELEKLREENELLKSYKTENDDLKTELSSLKNSTVPSTELDDLMLVMDDLETKKTSYKQKAKDLGAEVSSDEEDDDEEDNDE